MQGYSSLLDNAKGIFWERRGRISAPTFVVAMAAWFLLSMIFIFILKLLCIILPFPLDVICMIGFAISVVYSFLVLVIKRCHDLNHSGWFALLVWIPILLPPFLLYLSLRGGLCLSNRFGPPNTYSFPKAYAFLGYPIFALCMLSLVGATFMGLFVKEGSTTLEVLNSLPGPIRKAISQSIFENESTVIISSEGRDIALGFFITEDRLVVRGVNSRIALQKEMEQQKKLQVKGVATGQKTQVRRFIASDNVDGPLQMAVFEVDEPIGKPAKLDERNRIHLEKIRAFKK